MDYYNLVGSYNSKRNFLKKLFIIVLLATPVVYATTDTSDELFNGVAALGDGILVRTSQERQTNLHSTTAPIPSAKTHSTYTVSVDAVDAIESTGYAPTGASVLKGDLTALMKITGRMPYEEVDAIATGAVPAPPADLAELLRLEEGLRMPEYP